MESPMTPLGQSPSAACQKNNNRWSLNQKKKLYTALRIYGPDDMDAIQSYVGCKTKEQIEFYLQILRNNMDQKVTKPVLPPVDLWLKMAEDMTHGQEDISHNLGKVMESIAQYEDHPPVARQTDPDYRAIYSYLGALLEKKTLPELRPIDAIIVLELRKDLVNSVKSYDFDKATEQMREKHKAVYRKFNVNKKRETYEDFRKVFGFPEVQTKQVEETTLDNLPVPFYSFGNWKPDLHKSGVYSNPETLTKESEQNRLNPSEEKMETDETECNKKSQSTPSKRKILRATRLTSGTKSNGTPPANPTPSEQQALKLPLFTLNPFYIFVDQLKPPPRHSKTKKK